MPENRKYQAPSLFYMATWVIESDITAWTARVILTLGFWSGNHSPHCHISLAAGKNLANKNRLTEVLLVWWSLNHTHILICYIKMKQNQEINMIGRALQVEHVHPMVWRNFITKNDLSSLVCNRIWIFTRQHIYLIIDTTRNMLGSMTTRMPLYIMWYLIYL